jgi:predicted nucleic acid-binding protein
LAAIDFVLSGAITMVPLSLESLKKTKKLMEKYKDIPMDYADATLVVLAEDLSINEVVTFDSKHFGIYRLSSKQSFTILP